MSRTGFRLLLIVYLVSLAGIAAGLWYLPLDVSEDLAAAYAAQPPPPLARNHNLFLVVGVTMIGVTFAAPIALFFFKSWARPFAACATLAALIMLLFLGPSLETGLETAMSQLSAMLWGAILALAYFSSLRDEFRW